MSVTASQFTDGALPTVLGEVDSIEGVPFGKRLTQRDLRVAGDALQEFMGVIEAEDRESASPEARDGEARDEKEEVKEAHCIVVAGGLGFRNIERTESTEEDVRNCCYRNFGYPPATPRDIVIHMILDSRGGSLDTAFKIVHILRRFAKHIRIYVPRRAKSAATLIAIGADVVLMSPFGELGPLDTQISDPRNPTKTVSALDCYQSKDYVLNFGLETLPNVLGVLLRETEARIPLSELITIATRFALDEVSPILGQVNALDFGGWGRTLKIGETYARALQRRKGTTNVKKAAEIANKLVYQYPHHPYFIDYEEAQDIGLDVNLMTQNEYEASLRVAEACEGGRCVGFVDDIRAMEKDAPLSMDGDGSRRWRHADIPVAYDPGAPRAFTSEAAGDTSENVIGNDS